MFPIFGSILIVAAAPSLFIYIINTKQNRFNLITTKIQILIATKTNMVDSQIQKCKLHRYFTFEGGKLKFSVTGETFTEYKLTVDAACKFDIKERPQTPHSVAHQTGRPIKNERYIVKEAKGEKYSLPKIYKDDFNKIQNARIYK